MSKYNMKSSNSVDSADPFLRIRGLMELNLLIVIISLTVIGYFLTITTGDIPSGADPGNWLYISHQIGKQEEWFVPPYPPMVPSLLRIFEAIWGTFLGLKLIGFFALLFSGVSIYFLLKPLNSSMLILLASLSIPFASYNMEVLSWGGYPQLLASGFTILSLVSFNNLIIKPSKINAIMSAFLISLVINTNILVSALLAVSLVVLFLIQIYSSKIELQSIQKIAIYFFSFFILFTLPAIPSYILTFQLSTELATGTQGLQNIFIILEYVFRNNREYWILLGLLSAISYKIPSNIVIKQLKIFCFSLLVSSLILIFLLNEPRFGTYIQFSIILTPIALIFIVEKFLKKNSKELIKIGTALTKVILVILLLINIQIGLDNNNKTSIYYNVIDKNTIRAFDWIKDNINSNETIACASYNTYGNAAPLGWWIEGYTGIHTFVGSDPKWMSFNTEKRNAVLANLLFDDSVTITDKIQIMKTYNISYLFLDTRGNISYDDLKNSSFFKQVYDEQINIYALK